MSDLNQELIELLPGLYHGDSRSIDCVNDRFLVPLTNMFGKDAANEGLCKFFRRLAGRPLKDESNPQAFLYTCCRRAKYLMWRKGTYNKRLEILRIISGFPCRIEVSSHELSVSKSFSISQSNAAPTLNRKFGTGAATAYTVIDKDCLELHVSLAANEIDYAKYLGHLLIRTRKNTCSIDAIQSEDSTLLDPTEQLERKEFGKQLGLALEKLDEQERWLITMWFYADPRPSQKELAEQLGVSDRTVRSLIKRAITKLRSLLSRFKD